MNPFDKLVQRRSDVVKSWALRTFADGTTYRIFAHGESTKIKKFLRSRVGEGRKLAACRTETEYSREVVRLTRSLQKRLRTRPGMKHPQPNFGETAKVVDLYVKALTHLPKCLLPHGEALEQRAHVILDNRILARMWGTRQEPGDFWAEMRALGVSRRPTLNHLDQKTYLKFQQLLAKYAHRKKMSTIAYDYFWTLRKK